MRIGSIKENQNIEKRIAITPETIKKYSSLGLEICLSKNYGSHIGIDDKEYSDLGVKIFDDENKILNSSDIIVQLGMLSDNKTSLIKEIDFVFENLRSNFLVITKSTLSLLKFSIF